MQSSIYSSNATNKSARKRKKNPVSQLALDSFEAFKPFINIFDPGTKDWAGTVVHAITKEDWRLFRRHKDGERNLTYLDNREFKPGRDIVQNIYSPHHVHRHIDGGEVSYYTSGKNGLALAYWTSTLIIRGRPTNIKPKPSLKSCSPSATFGVLEGDKTAT